MSIALSRRSYEYLCLAAGVMSIVLSMSRHKYCDEYSYEHEYMHCTCVSKLFTTCICVEYTYMS